MIHNDKILTEIKGSTATIWLNRPEIHNALDMEMISDLRVTMSRLNASPEIRVVIFRGRGKSFCAGADLHWMQQSALLSSDENLLECRALARCFNEIYTSSRITVCMVHGSCYGGANGITATCDIVFAEYAAEFAFSEVRVGLVPATIAPYIIHKTGKAKAMEFLLAGRKFSAAEAEHAGLINKTLPASDLEAYTFSFIDDLLQGAPEAQRIIKEQMNSSGWHEINDDSH